MKYLIVGYGNIGHKRKETLGKKCVATFDSNPNSGADYQKLDQIPLSIFDAAVLTVPQIPKFELTKYFLSQKKHVLVEKPLIITKSEGKILTNLGKKNKVIWHTSYNHRFEPNIQKIKSLMERRALGPLYHAYFRYSFGNIQERIGTWRETENGVLEEIAPHVIDFIMTFFGYKGKDFKLILKRKVESKIYDHWLYGTADQKIMVENSSIIWKNVFSIEIYGKLGSIHMEGLNKWGGSRLIIRKRILPSGVPIEKISATTPPDNTWKKDFAYFEKMVRLNKNSLISDLEVSNALSKITNAN